MTLFAYRLGIRLFTLLGLISFLIFVLGLDPGSLSQWGIVFFFASLWVLISGLFVLILLFIYGKAIGEASTAHFIGGVLRQGTLLGSFGFSVLLLLYFKFFAWWIVLLLFLFFLLLEFTLRRIFHTHE